MGGETWQSLLHQLETNVTAWQTAAAARGLTPGIALIWLTGNDVYSRVSRMSSFGGEILDRTGRAATAAILYLRRRADDVVVLGPLPRLAGEVVAATWESTAGFHLERTLLKLEVGCRLVMLGRALTRKMRRSRHGLVGCQQWFEPDGVHLSPEGYAKLADAAALPIWLTFRAAR